jgi:hypothetical protein
MTSAVNAGVITAGDSIRFFDKEGSTGGGEFGVAELPAYNVELFRTFCLEKTEHIDFSKYGFKVVGVTTTAYDGSVGPAGDPLDPMTAYLYTAFVKHTLVSGYDYTAGTAQHIADANALQHAIWFIEQEPGVAPLAGKALAFYNEAVAAGWKTLGDVRVLNLEWNAPGDPFTKRQYAEGTKAQDVLYIVPEPSVMILLGLGLVGIGVSRRRRS